MKKAILFGASGLVGSHLLTILANDLKYDKVICPVRKSFLKQNSKVVEVVIDFDQLENYQELFTSEKIDEVYCCLGTTMKKAKTKSNFTKVDFEYPLKIAKLAKKSGIENFFLVSSVGANKKSFNFYLRTKGQLESELEKLEFKKFKSVRPSFLLGERKEDRKVEEYVRGALAEAAFLFVGPLKKYQPVEASVVAKQLFEMNN